MKQTKTWAIIFGLAIFVSVSYYTIYRIKTNTLGEYEKVTIDTELNTLIKDLYMEYGSIYIKTTQGHFVIYHATSGKTGKRTGISSNTLVGDSIRKKSGSNLIRVIHYNNKVQQFYLRE